MKLELDIKSVVDEFGTQKAFAEASGIHPNVIGNLYHGVTMVGLKTLAKIMAFTGKQPNDLFVITEED